VEEKKNKMTTRKKKGILFRGRLHENWSKITSEGTQEGKENNALLTPKKGEKEQADPELLKRKEREWGKGEKKSKKGKDNLRVPSLGKINAKKVTTEAIENIPGKVERPAVWSD